MWRMDSQTPGLDLRLSVSEGWREYGRCSGKWKKVDGGEKGPAERNGRRRMERRIRDGQGMRCVPRRAGNTEMQEKAASGVDNERE